MLDASVLVEYIFQTPRSTSIESIVTASDCDLHVPTLCDVEVCSALRRALLAKRLSEQRAAEALEDYFDLPLIRHGHLRLLERVLQLRENFSAYDATYLSLAESLGALFVTADDSLARAVRRHLPDLQLRK